MIDHDHVTGAVRGLLCYTHNTGLGMFQDNKDLLLNAVKYLEQYKFVDPPVLKKKKVPFPFKTRLEQLINDPQYATDSQRAEALHKESGVSLNASRVRVSRWRKKSHLQDAYT